MKNVCSKCGANTFETIKRKLYKEYMTESKALDNEFWKNTKAAFEQYNTEVAAAEKKKNAIVRPFRKKCENAQDRAFSKYQKKVEELEKSMKTTVKDK